MDVAVRVSDGEEGLFIYHLVGDVFEMYSHVLEVGHRFIEVVVYDVCGDAVGPFACVKDDRVAVNLEFQ